MYYGFDIGGSKIALGVFDNARQLQWEKRVPTPTESYEAFLQAIEALVREADRRFGVEGAVGIGIPGMPETADGKIVLDAAELTTAATGQRKIAPHHFQGVYR
ncbi:ROK family protein [Klebsiella aerogenes]|uniref:ROK family protein n=1 Tax=Klebsiella aerogenes TaxID=548 RepID=UPI003877D0E8